MKQMTDEAFQISVEFGTDDSPLPSARQIRSWAINALEGLCQAASVDMRIVDRAEIHATNLRYRNIDRPTNVLSFSAELPAGVGLNHLGDIMISAPVVAEEALAQGKTSDEHWAHLVTHGILHLLGYDHEADAAALEMERLERQILNRVGIILTHE
jgi:probable rRNA maturation factor